MYGKPSLELARHLLGNTTQDGRRAGSGDRIEKFNGNGQGR
jgi:hypothetical protein